MIQNNIYENMALEAWIHEDLHTSITEIHIWNNLKMSLNNPLDINPWSAGRILSPEKWSPNSNGFFKCNFDGVSKRNPRNAGFRGIINNSQGDPLRIYYRKILCDSNNSTELEGLIQGTKISIEFHYFLVEMEGDSQIITMATTKVLQGRTSSKVSNS